VLLPDQGLPVRGRLLIGEAKYVLFTAELFNWRSSIVDYLFEFDSIVKDGLAFLLCA